MKESKKQYDTWFDELYEDLSWEFACEEQENYNKAVDLAMSFSPLSEKR